MQEIHHDNLMDTNDIVETVRQMQRRADPYLRPTPRYNPLV